MRNGYRAGMCARSAAAINQSGQSVNGSITSRVMGLRRDGIHVLQRFVTLFVLLFVAPLLFCSPAYALRDDVLVLVNDNSIDSPQVGAYYAQQRDIDPANIVHVRVRDGYFITWTEFRRLRDQVIRFMQQNTLDDPNLILATCPDGDPPYYCKASMDQLRAHTKIRYIVTTRGIPTRTTVDGSTLSYPGPTSVDNYLRFWLINYYNQDTPFSAQVRASAFLDGRGMRTVMPAQDGELIVGRIDGVTLTAAKALVDRALDVEGNGLFGKLYGSKYGVYSGSATWKDHSTPYNNFVYGDSTTSWRYQLGLMSEARSECIDYLDYPYNQATGKAPQYCFARMTDGNDPAQGVSSSRASLADDALAYLGSLDGQTTGAGDFNNLLNWRKDNTCSVTLCDNASDPAACRAASTDPFRDINTQCVGVAEGFIGYNYQSYPVSFLTVWPTGWRSTDGGDFNNLAFPEVRSDLGYDDNYSLWFRTVDQVAAPLCYTSSDFTGPPTQTCPDERRVYFYQTIAFTAKAVTATPQQYRIGLRYKANNLTKTGALRVRLWVHEKDATANLDYGYKNIVTLPLGNTDWTYGEVVFTLDPAKHTRADDLYDRIQVDIDTSAVVAGELGLDTASIQELGAGIELAQNGSFNKGHKSVSGGDHAANYLSRLNGTAFWGSVSHHATGGHSFGSHPMETLLYFMRGLPLGDAVWFYESLNSGILYGDPLYSPMAVKFDYQPYAGDRLVGATQFSGSTVNGRDATRISTEFRVDYCLGKDFYLCDQDQSWLPTGMSGLGGRTSQPLGSWDLSTLPYGEYTLRLAVTSSNSVTGKTQTFNDYYPIKHRYSTTEIPLYNISGYAKEPNGQPVVGVTFAINDNYGFTSSVTTDANGYYKSAGLKNGLYIVYPAKQGYNVAPNSGNIFQSVSNAHVRKDFTATRSGYSITGTVMDAAGQPLGDVPIQFSGPNGYTATAKTNVMGYYGLGSLANGSYTVIASLPGFTITPVGGSTTALVNGADVSKAFTATTQGYAVSGTILNTKGQSLAGVQIQINNNGSYVATATTNANGYFHHGGLANGLYIVYPSFSGYTISPNSGSVFTTISGADVVGKDFTATPIIYTYSVSGFILENGQPLPGVSVAINDNYGFTSTVTTDSSGFYYKDGLKNGLYIVYPSKSGYQFQTTSGNIFQSISGSNVISKNYNATHN